MRTRVSYALGVLLAVGIGATGWGLYVPQAILDFALWPHIYIDMSSTRCLQCGRLKSEET